MSVAVPAIVLQSVESIVIPSPTRSSSSWSRQSCRCNVCKSNTLQKTFIPRSGAFQVRATSKRTKKYFCSYCDKSFLQSSNLIIHQRTHTGKRPYVCIRCDKRFTQSSNLRRHFRVHTGEKPWQCIVCGKRCSRKGSLSSHQRIHFDERPYQCSLVRKPSRFGTAVSYMNVVIPA